MRWYPVRRGLGGLVGFVAWACVASSVAEDSARCDSNLVETGDWPGEEHWYYNHGSTRFVRRFVFRHGELQRIETLDRGFSGNEPCSVRDIREGMSEFELVMRCGQPESKRFEWYVGHHHGHGVSVRPVAEWLYSFGNNRFRRVVRIEDGDVRRIESRDKPD